MADCMVQAAQIKGTCEYNMILQYLKFKPVFLETTFF